MNMCFCGRYRFTCNEFRQEDRIEICLLVVYAGSGALTLGNERFCSLENGCKPCPVCKAKVDCFLFDKAPYCKAKIVSSLVQSIPSVRLRHNPNSLFCIVILLDIAAPSSQANNVYAHLHRILETLKTALFGQIADAQAIQMAKHSTGA